MQKILYAEAIHKKMAIEPGIIAELKEKLLQEEARIKDELSRIAKPTEDETDYVTSFEEVGDDEDENATEIKDYTDNLAVETTLEKQLKDVLDALEKIENGTYGKCDNCKADIPIDRLQAYPAAKTCIKCQ
jgi:RNA polymerase-binding transcription factor DksA